MKVCHVVPTLQSPAGGIERIVWDLLKGLPPDVENHVVGLDEPGSLTESYAEMSVDVISARKDGQIDLGSVRRVLRYIDGNDIDVVHLHNRWVPLHVALYLRRTPLVISYYNLYDLEMRGDSAVRRAKMRLAYQLRAAGDGMICVSESVRETYFPEPRDDVHVVYPGFHVNEVRETITETEPLLDRTDIPEDGIVIGSIGRLVKQKGIADLIRAMQHVEMEATLAIAGDGAERERLGDLVESLGLEDNVVFTGYVDEPHAFYKSIDIGAMASYYEGMPSTAIEMCFNELSLVVTSITPHEELFRRTDVPMVEPGRPEEMAAALDRVAGDADLRNRIATQVSTLVDERFDVRKTARRHREIYAAATDGQ
jgi:glycosyltransferase involved in cell wall biosynthesis